MDHHAQNKALIAPLRAAMYNFSSGEVREALGRVIAKDASIHLCHPIGNVSGPYPLYERAYCPLLEAFPDLERRDYIVAAGEAADRSHWVGCAGFYSGTFAYPWLDIPPTGQIAVMRFHEFYKIENQKVTEVQAIWDIPELMMQADVWPMAPALGAQILVPSPALQDGISGTSQDAGSSEASKQLVLDMLEHLNKHPREGGPEVMQMERFWHPRMNWYGPAGIGTARGIDGFRKRHQIPFLKAMPDRGQYPEETTFHLFAEGNYVAVTGWPDMVQTLTGDGWLGLAPTGQRLKLRSLDFWRIESGLIRENWVLVDLLDVFSQVGIDVFARMRERTHPASPSSMEREM